ncbi:MAG: hypothetical protein F6K15_35435 [Okeania sp. SIO2B3]|nr:hypothetical protein [Okeania sp. SIO2B3]
MMLIVFNLSQSKFSSGVTQLKWLIRWRDGEMGRWGDGEMGRWGDKDT